MLAFAYDEITRNADGSRITARPNCQVWHGPEASLDRRYNCGTLLGMCILERHLVAFERTDVLLAQGRPFVYPLELRANLRESLTLNPELAPGMPKAVLERLRASGAAIMIWIGHEPVPFHLDPAARTWAFDVIQNFIRQHDLPPQQIWLVSGNVMAEVSFEAWRRARGLPAEHTFRLRTLVLGPSSVAAHYRAGERGEILMQAQDEATDVWTFDLEPVSPEDFAQRYVQPAEIAAERRGGTIRPKRFLALNQLPRLHRVIVVSYLASRGLLDDSLVSMGHGAPPDGGDLGAFPNLGPALVESWRAIHARLPLVVDRGPGVPDRYTGGPGIDVHRIPFGWPYRETYINLVTETEMGRDVAPICTEKFIKPILNLQPAIAITTQHTLRHLRGLGFMTYAPAIREDFDAIADPVERLSSILAEIDRLAGLTPAQLRDVFFDCLPALEHNRARLLETRHQLEGVWEEIEVQLG